MEFLAAFDAEIVLVQVLIRRVGRGFELRHAADRDVAAELLESVPMGELRPLAQFTVAHRSDRSDSERFFLRCALFLNPKAERFNANFRERFFAG
jgi:hypothetical protein